jgi:tRNA 5-methylaminomethyl-2-thiouridine biosynthesis bifunctional protein
LHYVALVSAAPPLEPVLSCATQFPQLQELLKPLAPQWFGLTPGFHRITLNGGHVLLTLCVGDSIALLRQQQFVADSVYLHPDPPDHGAASASNIWLLKALARCCRRGTGLAATAGAADWRVDLTQCGFAIQASQAGLENGLLMGQFSPHWPIKQTRAPALDRPLPVQTCAVIGAGLAGASVAAALARRGWQVQVLDQAETPAAGASALPVGLVVPHVSADDCALSRLSRAGVRLMLEQARSLLQQGQDWDASGTLERRFDGAASLPSIWHPQAAWLKPASLVRAWLAQPGITFQGGARVASLRQSGAQWDLLDAQGAVLTSANRVVLANAGGAPALLDALRTALPALGLERHQRPILHGVRGQLSWALHPGGAPDAAFPATPVNGAGSVIPLVPVPGGTAWFVGSSYQPEKLPAKPDHINHSANLGRVQQLLPELGHLLAAPFADGTVQAWKGTRCVSADRLPLVGPLDAADAPSLWLCAGMGSRGLSLAVLCAELLAARWGAEPLPLQASLARALDAWRGDNAA